MRILVHVPAPWTPAGYPQQGALFLPRWRDLGHEVIVSAVNQYLGSPLMWQDIEVYPSGAIPYGEDVLPGYVADLKPDLLLTITDTWKLPAHVIRELPCPVACWTFEDADKAAIGTRLFFEQAGARPLAPSRHAERLLAEWDPLYVPCGVDTATFTPPADRAAVREEFGLGETTFAAAIVAMNKGVPSRKAFFSQMAGFAAFHRKHPDSVLMIHSQMQPRDGEDLAAIADDTGILDAVRWTRDHRLVTGQVTPADLASLYGAADVTLMCSMAEGFGVPVIESMACGTPVIASRCSALTELVPPAAGWLVSGIEFWNPAHRARWLLPDPAQVARALVKARDCAGRKRQAAREHALAYDADHVTTQYWKPVLQELEAGREAPEASPVLPPAEITASPGWLSEPPEDARAHA